MKKYFDMSYISNKPFEHFMYITYPDVKQRRYMIGDHGSIYSPKYDKFLKPRIDKDGYRRVKLRRSKGKTILTCRLKSLDVTNKMISKRLGIDRNYLSNIFRGESWAHVSKDYELPPPRVINFRGFDINTKETILKFLGEGLKPKEICEKLNIPHNKIHRTAIMNLRKKL